MLKETFEGARQFGLTSDEVWHEIEECLYGVAGEATVDELLEELSTALAARILAKERRVLSERAATQRAARQPAGRRA
jgi:hypothetical protein